MPAIARANVPIPDEYVNEVIRVTEQQSAVMRLATTRPMARGTQTQPVLSLLPTASWVNPTDTGQKPMSIAQWQGIHLTAEEIAVIVPIPENVLDDATFDIAGEVQDAIAGALAQQIDQTLLFGTSAPASFPAGGIYAVARGAGNYLVRGAVAGQDFAEDLNQVMALVENDGYEPDGFVLRRGVKSQLRGLRDSIGQPIFAPGSGSGPGLQLQQLDSIYGNQVTYSQLGFIGTPATADPTHAAADAFVGDWDMAVIGIRRDMTFKLLDQAVLQNPDGTIAYNLPQQDMIALRCVMRIGFAVARPAARASSAPDAAHQAPFAVLLPVSST
jgi:HK97 family phage major capsid protein